MGLLGLRARLQDRGLVITARGLWLCYLFGQAQHTMPGHQMVRRTTLRRILSDIAEGISGPGVYCEGHVTHALGWNGCWTPSPRSRRPASNRIWRCRAPGPGRCANGQMAEARARVAVNAGGAWIDAVNARLGIDTQLMGGSRGSHLAVDNPALLRALGGRMVYCGTADGRVGGRDDILYRRTLRR